jgi:hypothetical protein
MADREGTTFAVFHFFGEGGQKHSPHPQRPVFYEIKT